MGAETDNVVVDLKFLEAVGAFETWRNFEWKFETFRQRLNH